MGSTSDGRYATAEALCWSRTVKKTLVMGPRSGTTRIATRASVQQASASRGKLGTFTITHIGGGAWVCCRSEPRTMGKYSYRVGRDARLTTYDSPPTAIGFLCAVLATVLETSRTGWPGVGLGSSVVLHELAGRGVSRCAPGATAAAAHTRNCSRSPAGRSAASCATYRRSCTASRVACPIGVIASTPRASTAARPMPAQTKPHTLRFIPRSGHLATQLPRAQSSREGRHRERSAVAGRCASITARQLCRGELLGRLHTYVRTGVRPRSSQGSGKGLSPRSIGYDSSPALHCADVGAQTNIKCHKRTIGLEP
eukprot:scaffold1885_cov402-Prasinococcus_capsulatus_cf.AAC.21